MNFRRIAGNLPHKLLLLALEQHPELWERHMERQEFPLSPHWATQSIYLRGPREFTFENYFGTTDAVDYEMPADVFRAASLVVGAVYGQTKASELGRVLIVKLPPGGVLIEHEDQGAYAEHFERVHVALQTNEQAVLVCNGEAQHIPAGECWWFNHRAPHTARNLGESDRLHMIVDLVAPLRTNDGPEPDRHECADD